MKIILNLIVSVSLVSAGFASAADTGASWTGPGIAEIDGITIEVTRDGGDDFSTFTYDASGSNFSFAPLSAEEVSLSYSQNSNLSVSFSSPIERLRLYLVYWRSGTYQLNRSFEIKSGSNFTQSGNEITVTGGFASGVIEFTEPVFSLEILSSAYNTGNFSGQILQFGTGSPDAVSHPIPRLKINGGPVIRSQRKTVTVRGTAVGTAAIQMVEVRAANGRFVRAKGTANWSYRFQPKRQKTRLTARAVDQSGLKSSESSVNVIMEARPAADPATSPRKGNF